MLVCWYAYLCVYGWFAVLSEQMGYVSQSPLSQRKEVNGLSAHVYACVCVNSPGLKDCPPANVEKILSSVQFTEDVTLNMRV